MADYPYIPETITVHLGTPDDVSAPNVTVPFLSYIQNVASSEIYPTWPESAIRANIYAQVTFALNRIYTEYYRSRGYDFDITNSTAYDQSFVYGRDIFENISQITGEIFDQYLARPGAIQPLFSAYCDGRRVQCNGLSQWGSVALAQQGYTPYQILTYYYGNDLDIRTAPVRPIAESYPGIPLRLGLVSDDVRLIQIRLNRIAENYPAIPRVPVTASFDAETLNSVTAFQNTFGLTPDGVIGKSTWYQIQRIYNAVKRLNDLNAEALGLSEVDRRYPRLLQEGSSGGGVQVLQYFLSVISAFYPTVPQINTDGYFGPETRNAVIAYQLTAGLTPDGIVGPVTWNHLNQTYTSLLNLNAVNTPSGTPLYPLAPGQFLLLGSESSAVLQIQQWINRLSTVIPELSPVPETGYFGQNTRQAVITFQELFGLEPNGIVGPITWEQLATEAASL